MFSHLIIAVPNICCTKQNTIDYLARKGTSHAFLPHRIMLQQMKEIGMHDYAV
jgi:hypothetical protein